MATTTTTTTGTSTITVTDPAAVIKLEPVPSETRQNALSNTSGEPQPPAETPPDEVGIDRATYLKLISAGLSFLVTGVNDGSIGAPIPYIIREHKVSTAIVSIM